MAPSRAWVAFAIVALAVPLLGAAESQPAAGSLTPVGAPYRVLDVEGALVVHFGAGNAVAVDDLLLTPTACCAAGTFVAEGNADLGRMGALVLGAVTYTERDLAYGASLGDDLYVDLDGSTDVSAGDYDFAGARRVPESDGAVGRPLGLVGDGAFRLKHLDLDGDLYLDAPDRVLLDVTRLPYATANDVVLTPTGTEAFGSRLTTASADHVPATRNAFLSEPWLAYVDRTLDGPSPDDGFYIMFDRGDNVSAGAVRVLEFGGKPPGSRVRTGDVELSRAHPALAFPGPLGQARNPAARYEFETDLYIDADSGGTVSVDDLRLSMGPFAGFLSSTLVQGGDADVGRSLDRLATTLPLKFADANGNGFHDVDDALYLDVTDRSVPALGDVRLAVGSSPFGARVLESDLDHVPAVRRDFAASPRLMFWDVQTANGRVDAREPLFVHLAEGNATAAGDVRLAELPPQQAGSRVREGDADEDAPLTRIAYGLSYRDGDGHAGFNAARLDVLYLDLEPIGRVNEGDIRLTDARNETQPLRIPGSRVAAGSSEVGQALRTLARDVLPLKYLDRNGNGRFDSDAAYPDVLYLDLTGAPVPAPGDVRLGRVEVRGTPLPHGSKVALADPDAALPAYDEILFDAPTRLPGIAGPPPEDELSRLRRLLEEAEQDLGSTEEELRALRDRIAELEAERAEERREARRWGPAAFLVFGLGIVVLGASVYYFGKRRAAARKRARRAEEP